MTFETKEARKSYVSIGANKDNHISEIYCGVYQLIGIDEPQKRLYVECIRFSNFSYDVQYAAPVPHYQQILLYSVVMKDFEGNFIHSDHRISNSIRSLASNQPHPYSINIADEMLGKKQFLTPDICKWALEVSVSRVMALG